MSSFKYILVEQKSLLDWKNRDKERFSRVPVRDNVRLGLENTEITVSRYFPPRKFSNSSITNQTCDPLNPRNQALSFKLLRAYRVPRLRIAIR